MFFRASRARPAAHPLMTMTAICPVKKKTSLVTKSHLTFSDEDLDGREDRLGKIDNDDQLSVASSSVASIDTDGLSSVD